MATPARSSQAVANRERARAARIALDAERIKRDELIEETAASVFGDLDAGAQLREQLVELDKSIGTSIDTLLGAGRLPVKDVAALLDLPEAEVRRLRTPPARGRAKAASETDGESVVHSDDAGSSD